MRYLQVFIACIVLLLLVTLMSIYTSNIEPYNISKSRTIFTIKEIKYSNISVSLYKVEYYIDAEKKNLQSFVFVDSVKKFQIGDKLIMEIR